MRFLIIIFFITIFPIYSYPQLADNVLLLTSLNLDSASINTKLIVLEDKTSKFTLKEASSPKLQGAFKKFHEMPKKWDKKAAYWGKLVLKNCNKYDLEIILKLGKKRESDFADVYFIDSAGVVGHKKSGYFIKASEKDLVQELGSKVSLFISKGQTLTIYIRIQNISGFAPKLDLQVTTPRQVDNEIKLRNFVQGAIQGILWIVIFYNILLFVLSGDTTYAIYAGFVICMALNFLTERGLLLETIFKEAPRLNEYVFALSTCFASVCYQRFMQKFLNTYKFVPKWHKILNIVMIIKVVQAIILVPLLYFTFNLPLSINICNYSNFAELLLGIPFIVAMVRSRNAMAKYYTVAYLAMVIGTLIYLFFLMSKAPLSFSPQYFMNVGTIMEVLFFSLGLGFKIRVTEGEKRKAQEAEINALYEKDRLQSRINLELEEKVAERTLELVKQKQHIMDSINYARHLQNALLPSDALYKDLFSDYFIFYSPKDIVSGDFYWLSEKDDKIFVAVCDCTGHGVPGALMSVLGIALLNEMVNARGFEKPDRILLELRQEVKYSLSQTAEGLQKDGMDMVLCVIDKETKHLQFAGAHNSIYIVRDNELIQLHGDKQPIGIHLVEKDFTNHEFKLRQDDIIYMFSDGYHDQMGGPANKKFMVRNFRQLIHNISQLPMSEQYSKIEKTMSDWKGNSKQVDDVLVMGIKI